MSKLPSTLVRLALFAVFGILGSLPASADYCATNLVSLTELVPNIPVPLRNYLANDRVKNRLVAYEVDPAFKKFSQSIDDWMILPKGAGSGAKGSAVLERENKYEIRATISSANGIAETGKVKILFEIDNVKRFFVLNRPMGPAADVVMDVQMMQISLIQKLFNSFGEKDLSALTVEWKLGRNAPKEITGSLKSLGLPFSDRKLSRCNGLVKVLVGFVGGAVGANVLGAVAYELDDAVMNGDNPYGLVPWLAAPGAVAGGWSILRLTCGPSKTRAGGFAYTFQRVVAP